MFRVSSLTLVTFALLCWVSALAQTGGGEDYDERSARLISVVAETEDFTDWLANYGGWQGSASPHDGDNLDGGWYIEFKAEDGEWLGYANINALSGEIDDSFIPRPLPEAELAEGRVRVRALVLADPEVAERIQDPLLWDIESDYDRYEVEWNVNFYRGLEHLRVIAQLGDNFYIEEVRNERVLGEEEALEHSRNEAVRLAYQEVGDALDGLDNWRTYAEHQGGTRWSVAFVTGETERFYALVDVANEEVLESGGPQ